MVLFKMKLETRPGGSMCEQGTVALTPAHNALCCTFTRLLLRLHSHTTHGPYSLLIPCGWQTHQIMPFMFFCSSTALCTGMTISYYCTATVDFAQCPFLSLCFTGHASVSEPDLGSECVAACCNRFAFVVCDCEQMGRGVDVAVAVHHPWRSWGAAGGVAGVAGDSLLERQGCLEYLATQQVTHSRCLGASALLYSAPSWTSQSSRYLYRLHELPLLSYMLRTTHDNALLAAL